MFTKIKLTLAMLGLTGLVACGDTAVEQALLGGGAGAGTAILLDGDILTGAAVGAAGNVIYCQTGKRKRC
ncbi:MAG: hypothetical protein AB8B82_16920 [Roseovarius sp.]